MKISTVLKSIFLLIVCLCTASVWAESLPVLESKSDEIISEGVEPISDTVSENEDAGLEDTNNIGSETASVSIKDPIQPYNRSMFTFNDKAYYYVFKPISQGYKSMIHEKARLSVRNFFSNLKWPVRFVNCLLQGRFKGAGTETSRFVINSTIGIGGLLDLAKSQFHIEKEDRDFGQTLGKYKIGSGFFIEWPLIGPSTVRDTVGYLGDAVLNPLSFLLGPLENFGVRTFDTTNEISIDKGDTYESITKPAIDPYIAIQDAYVQNRIKKIKE